MYNGHIGIVFFNFPSTRLNPTRFFFWQGFSETHYARQISYQYFINVVPDFSPSLKFCPTRFSKEDFIEANAIDWWTSKGECCKYY